MNRVEVAPHKRISAFASLLRGAYKLSGAKKAFQLPEDEIKNVIEKQNRHRGVFTPTDHKAHYETITVNGFPCLIVREKPEPRHIVVVSPGEVPWNDAEKVRMQALNAKDVAIDYAFMVTVEKFMRHGQEHVPDYMISGSRGNFSGVGDIHFFYFADEVLYGALPDFEEARKRVDVPYTAFARPGMVHCYCMLPYFKEAMAEFAKIAEILKK